MDSAQVILGSRYRDTISGWEGVCTGRFEYLNGCVRVELSGAADGKPEGFVFDTQQLIPVVTAEVAGCTDACSECHTFVEPCELAIPPRARVHAPTAEELMADLDALPPAVRIALHFPEPQVDLVVDRQPVHPFVQFWRWLWNPPAEEPLTTLRLGRPPGQGPIPTIDSDVLDAAGRSIIPDGGVIPTGGPRSTPPRTGSR